MYNVYAQCIVAHITHKVSLGTTYTIFSSFHSSDTDTKVKHIKYSIQTEKKVIETENRADQKWTAFFWKTVQQVPNQAQYSA